MRTAKKWSISIIIVTSIFSVSAQDMVDTTYVERDVRIEKEYQPEVLENRRLNLELPAAEIQQTRNEVSYSGYNNPLSLTTPFTPSNQSEMSIMNRLNTKNGFARVGIGYPLIWLADLWYPLLEKKNDSFSFGLKHNGTYAYTQTNILTDVGLKYQHRFDRLNLNSYIGYGNQYFNYYGLDSLNKERKYRVSDYRMLAGDSIFTSHEMFHRVKVGIGIASKESNDGWNYQLGMGYNMLYLQNAGIGEHELLIDGEFGGLVGQHNLRIGIDIQTLFYSVRESAFPINKKTNAVFGIKPAYLMNWKDGSLQLGLKMYFSTSNGRVVNAMPDIKGVYNVKESIQLYAGIGGDYKINSISSIISENRFYNPYSASLKNSYCPFDFFIGVNIKPIRGLVVDASLSYNYTFDNYFFTNQSFAYYTGDAGVDSVSYDLSNVFMAESINVSQLKANVRISYNYKELYRIFAEGQFNNYYKKGTKNFDMPYKPMWEANLGAEIRVINPLVIHGNFYFASSRATGIAGTNPTSNLGLLKPIYDLNLGAHYTFNNEISLFIETSNWLSLAPSLRYYDWYGYQSLGFQCMIGASFAF